ncbi:adenine methyltransferase [Mesorhizobium sp. B2-6-4]|nr:adenine methyltransferase [Mesorhizobium sp. B2-6-4]TPM90194.1 adenine methyltransferase [Mesorhizobium sp. B2-1-5]
MKYMGSKRAMLRNGLGELIHREIAGKSGFADLFTGSAAVASHVSKSYPIPVRAFDIQSFSVVTASAIVTRNHAFDAPSVWQSWLQRARRIFDKVKIPVLPNDNIADIERVRAWCGEQEQPITKAYGGHYFSADQAVWLDALRLSVPNEMCFRDAAIAALIEAGSQCAASPGHTAQPFQPTPTAIRFLQEAWARNVLALTERALVLFGKGTAQVVGEAIKQDANIAVKSLGSGDLVFIDPPYSGVHYSRFYHVLETIADGYCGDVTGKGRYPSPSRRPRSSYSLKGQSAFALDQLLGSISAASATAILTFPDHQCSNGLSGEIVREIAGRHFQVDDRYVAARFSTLGGYSQSKSIDRGRHARQHANEMLLLLRP